MKICMTGNVFPFGEGLAYGGERVIYYLIRSLAERGHEIYLFAKEGTNVPKKYIKDYVPVGDLCSDRDVHYEAVEAYVSRTGVEFDVYQCNYFGDGWDPRILYRYPYVELTWCCWSHIAWQLKMQNFNTIAYSKALQNDFTNRGVDTSVIHYGIPKDYYAFQPDCDDYVVWIGKMEAGKNMKGAIIAAKEAGVKIVLMGPPYNMGHWQEQVAPYIDNQTVFWVRGVSDEQKQRIMSRAKAFISSNDNTWREHFGIVNIEALSMGVPIVGFNRLGQDCAIVQDRIIEDGKHGFIYNYHDSRDLDHVVQYCSPLIKRIGCMDRAACRRQFENNFTSELEAARYEWLYRAVVAGNKFQTVNIPF